MYAWSDAAMHLKCGNPSETVMQLSFYYLDAVEHFKKQMVRIEKKEYGDLKVEIVFLKAIANLST